MRRAIAAILVPVFMLLSAGAALAAFTQVASVHLTAHRAGQSTGIVSDIHSSDPTALGGKPKAARKVVMTFPRGTRFNLGTPLVKRCTLSDKQLSNQFGPRCPAKSRIGSGTAVANANPLVPKLDATASAFVRSAREMVIVVTPKASAYRSQIQVVHALVSANTLAITVPKIMVGGVVEVVLTSLKLKVAALGTGKRALITAGRCTAKRWVVTTRFTYADRSRLSVPSTTRCS